jgi:cell division protein FtsX
MSSRPFVLATAIAGLAGALLGLVVAVAVSGNCVQTLACLSDGVGGCLPGPCDRLSSMLLWALPLVGAALAAAAAVLIARGRSRRRDQRSTL